MAAKKSKQVRQISSKSLKPGDLFMLGNPNGSGAVYYCTSAYYHPNLGVGYVSSDNFAGKRKYIMTQRKVWRITREHWETRRK